MQRKLVIITLILNFALQGCALSGKRFRIAEETGGSRSVSFQETVNQNITVGGFFISKAEIKISDNNVSEKFLSSIKHNTEGKYLISLRSRTGIEGARIFISEDTILVNDRINRKLYFGSKEDLVKRLGVSIASIPLLFGDIILADSLTEQRGDCINGKLITSQLIGELNVKYTIDCRKSKVIATELPSNNSIKLNFSHFLKKSNKVFPAEIRIDDNDRNRIITITVKNIEYPWDGDIDFIPGTRYELTPLL